MILGNYHRIEFKPADTTKELYLFTGNEYKIEVYPLEWYEGQYYETYKNQTFKVDILTEKKTAEEYNNIKIITLTNKNLNTIFSSILLKKFRYLITLNLFDNPNLEITDISNNINLETFYAYQTAAKITDISNNINLKKLWISNTNSTITDISNNVNLRFLALSNTNSTITDISNNINLDNLVLNNTNSTITDISNNINLTQVRMSYTSSKITTVTNNTKLYSIALEGTNTTAENINQILQDLIINNEITSNQGIFRYSNLTGINGSLENQLTDLNWTLIKI